VHVAAPEVHLRLVPRPGMRRIRRRARVIVDNLLADGFELRQYEVGRRYALVDSGVSAARILDCGGRRVVAVIDAVRRSGLGPPSGVREPRRTPPDDGFDASSITV